VVKGLKYGITLFIASEVMLFFSLFWCFFHSSLSPAVEIGILWPPKGITPMDPFSIPLLNTAILLSSGVVLTWGHHNLLRGKASSTAGGIFMSILLGIIFTSFQIYEYKLACFSMADSVYGSIFFLITGFHGLHVIIGTIFLTVSLIRFELGQFTQTHHFGLEAAI
jgi:cytochrome c oxidase subunit 3